MDESKLVRVMNLMNSSEVLTGGIVIGDRVFAGRWNNDWTLQNTIEDSPPEDIYFFDPIPEGFYTPRDRRWEKVWAYVGRPMGYVYEDEGDAPDYVRDCIEFLIEVEYAGTVWYAKQVIHESDLEMANFDIYSFLLDEMVKRVDEYMDGRPNDE